ncbi:unnamed protein product, partial [marine sediment metagenome]
MCLAAAPALQVQATETKCEEDQGGRLRSATPLFQHEVIISGYGIVEVNCPAKIVGFADLDAINAPFNT